MPSDYYSVLELSRNCSQEDIRKAYRRLALKHHPDKNQDRLEEANARFKEISRAYEVLSDQNQRNIYDRYGEEGLSGRVPTNSRDEYPEFMPFHFHDPMEIFRRFFGDFTSIDDLIAPMFSSMPQSHPSGRTQRVSSRRSAGRASGSPYHHAGRSNQVQSYDPNALFGGGMLNSFFGNSMVSPFNMFNDAMFNISTSSSSSGFGGAGGFRSVSTSSQYVNGRMVKVTKVVENGTETITEEVDGQITNRTVRQRANGVMQAM